MVRPIALLLDTECGAPEGFEALLALGNLDSQNESTRKRVLKDAKVTQHIENYLVEDHKLILQEAVQCGTNRSGSKMWVIRCEGKNDKGKYCVAL